MARLVGNQAPFFKAEALVNGEFKTISSDDYKGKWKVLFFYPLDFTFVCPTELVAYSEASDKFKALGCELIACSVDSAHSHLAWTKQPRNDGGLGEVKYPILADLVNKNFIVTSNFFIKVGDDRNFNFTKTTFVTRLFCPSKVRVERVN